MSDAWNALGWTAQQPATYYTDDGIPGAWKLPSDVETVNISGRVGDIDGGLSHGYIIVEANAPLQHTASKTLVMQPHYYGLIAHDGTFSLTVPATDSPALITTSPPFIYTITIVLGRKLYRQFTATLPMANPSVNILDLMAAAPTTP